MNYRGYRGSATIGGISKGERSVKRTLISLRVKHYRETKFADCRGGSANLPLSFDFAIYIGDKLEALIEYQGIQHSVPTFGMEDWLKIKATDEIKRNYCKEKGIPLLEIPSFKLKDIDSIVVKFLKGHGILKRTRITA